MKLTKIHLTAYVRHFVMRLGLKHPSMQKNTSEDLCKYVDEALEGKKPVIVAVGNCSLAKIYVEREMDSIIETHMG